MADEQRGTEYVILVADVANPAQSTDGLHRFELLEEGDPGSGPATVRAANDKAALKVAEELFGREFEHGAVAVPARSWRVRKPETKMEPRRTWT